MFGAQLVRARPKPAAWALRVVGDPEGPWANRLQPAAFQVRGDERSMSSGHPVVFEELVKLARL